MEIEAEYVYDKIAIYDKYSDLVFKYIYIIEASDYKKIHRTKIHQNDLAKQPDAGINCLIELFRFKNNDILYVCFRVVSNIMVSGYYPMMRYAYKLHNSYTVDGKPYGDIKDIVYRQGVERSHIGVNCISTTYLSELIANKVEYSLFLKDRGLMDNTKLTVYGDVSKHKHVKIPYAKPTKHGVRQHDGLLNFHTSDLIVVQDINRIAIDYEFRCYCIDGKIDFAVIKSNNSKSDSKYTCINSELDGDDSKICKMIKEHKDAIQKLCTKTFYAMNRLVHYRLLKLKYELDSAKFIISNVGDMDDKINTIDKKAMLYTLLSLSNTRKKILLSYINGKYNKSIDPETFTIPVMDYSAKEDNYPIYDHFMRIDIALPDGGDYKKVTISNIDTFGDNRLKFKIIKDVVKTDGHNFNKVYQYILYKIVSNNPRKFTELV